MMLGVRALPAGPSPEMHMGAGRMEFLDLRGPGRRGLLLVIRLPGAESEYVLHPRADMVTGGAAPGGGSPLI
jgi:hypothetical protein